MAKTVTQYADDLKRLGNSPAGLAELDRELSANLAYLYDSEMKPNQLKKAKFWSRKESNEDGTPREKKLSDTAMEALWKLTPDGEVETRLDSTMKAYEVLLRSIKNSIIAASVELKHLN